MHNHEPLPDKSDDGQNEIVTELLTETARLKLEVVQTLSEPCDRATYGERLKAAAERLNCSVRTVQRLVKKWEDKGLAAFTSEGRSDKGKLRISKDWRDYIIESWNKGKCTPAQVAVKVKQRANAEGKDHYPSHMTVYRVLAPLIEKRENASKVRSAGWKGSRLALKTRNGEQLVVEYSNQVWQIDHTRADILLVDKYGELLSRPWLTTVIDTYSRCILGINLGFDAPSSKLVALALRHAILPKQYGSDYPLYVDWPVFGTPKHIFTDGGKDFRSQHLEQIGLQLGFTCHLRDRPSEGGIVERPFGAFNTEFFSTLPGYTGSNIASRPPDAEKKACLTLRELERLFVSYIVNRYNRGLDARMRNQTRVERWEAGLIKKPTEIPARQLDICLMKQTRRTIYRGGYILFENLKYQNDELAAHAGESVVVRYDPRDIKTILTYRREVEQQTDAQPAWHKEIYLGPAYVVDFEDEPLSLDEAKDISRAQRAAGQAVDNQSILNEVRDREAFLDQKQKTRRDRQKEEQAEIRPPLQTISPAPEKNSEPEEPVDTEIPQFEIWDFDED